MIKALVLESNRMGQTQRCNLKVSSIMAINETDTALGVGRVALLLSTPKGTLANVHIYKVRNRNYKILSLLHS